MFDTQQTTLPNRPGIGYKPQHWTDILNDPGPVAWFEVHAENYMGAGGRPHAQLNHLAERFPLSIHGVGASIGGAQSLDPEHVARLAYLVSWSRPARFSEHLAWSTHDGHFFNDLLPLPYTASTLTRVCDHIDALQEALAMQMLLENPSSYLLFSQSTWAEPDFLREVTRRTGCGLLLDINNVFVSATNIGFSPQEYIDALPLDRVGEIHLAGHDEDQDEHGAPLLIDSHGTEVAQQVWALLDYTLAHAGALPILVEWDTNVPTWPVLAAEAARAQDALDLLASGKKLVS